MAEKVLFTSSTFSHMLNFHVPYLKWFKERGWIVHAACGGEPTAIPYTDKAISLPLRKNMWSPNNFCATARLRRLIQTERYALISTHTSLAAFFTRLAVKGMRGRPKVVNTVHGYLFDDDTPAIKRRILLTAERLTATQTDLLLTMNRWDFRLAQKEKLGQRVAYIPGMGVDLSKYDRSAPENGASLRRELRIPSDAFVLIFPAEFSVRKSQKILIAAMTKLPRDCVLALPGQGVLLKECRTLTEKLGLAERVIFPGQVSDMVPWYAAANVAVTASRTEGLPFNVVEAMYCGLPVVASKVKGHIDLIEDGVTGLLYPYGDEDAFAEAVRRLKDSPPFRASLGAAARVRAGLFSLSAVFETVVSLYTD